MEVPAARTTGVTVSVRTFDDGAWVSVNDERRVGTSELWRLADPDFCGCRPADLLVEGYVAVGVDGPTVAARVYGRCIACGTADTTGWLAIGRVRDGTFRRLAEGAVRRPLTAAD
ncbi:MAG: hypothetical protein ABEJ85_03880 [Haloarculaceae archaeon]